MSSLLTSLKNTVNITSDAEDSLILKDILKNNPEYIISKLRGNSYILANDEFIIPNYRSYLATDKYNNSGEKLIFSAGDERVLVTVNSLDFVDKTTMDFDVYVNGLLLYSEDYYEESSRYGRNFYIKKTKFAETENVVNVITKNRINLESKYKTIQVTTEQFNDLTLTFPKLELGNFYDNTDYLILLKYQNGKFYKMSRNSEYFLAMNGNDISLIVNFESIDENSLFVLQNSLYYYEKESTYNLLSNGNSIPLTYGISDPANNTNTLILPLPIENTLGLEIYLNGYKLIPELDYRLYDKDGLKVQFSNQPLPTDKIRINTIPYNELNFDPVFIEYLKSPVYTDSVITEYENYQRETQVDLGGGDMSVVYTDEIINTWCKQVIDNNLQIVPVTKIPFDKIYHEVNISRTLVTSRNITNIDNIGFSLHGLSYNKHLWFRNTLLVNDGLKADLVRFKASELYLNSTFEKRITESYAQYYSRIEAIKTPIITSIGTRYKINNSGSMNELEIFKYPISLAQRVTLTFDSPYYLKFQNLEDHFTIKMDFLVDGVTYSLDMTAFNEFITDVPSNEINLVTVSSRVINNILCVFSSTTSYEIVRSKLIDIDIICENPIIFANGLETPRVKVIGYYEDFSTKDLTTDKNLVIEYPTLEAGEYGPIRAEYTLQGESTLEDYFYIYSKNINDYEYLTIDGEIPHFVGDNTVNGTKLIKPSLTSKFSGTHYLDSFDPVINESSVDASTFDTYRDFNVTLNLIGILNDLGNDISINSFIYTRLNKFILADTSYINAKDDVLMIPSSFFKPVFNSLTAKYIDIYDEQNNSIIFGMRNYTERRFLVMNTKQYIGKDLLVVIKDVNKKIINSYPARVNYVGEL